jgi:hypothetical protein
MRSASRPRPYIDVTSVRTTSAPLGNLAGGSVNACRHGSFEPNLSATGQNRLGSPQRPHDQASSLPRLRPRIHRGWEMKSCEHDAAKNSPRTLTPHYKSAVGFVSRGHCPNLFRISAALNSNHVPGKETSRPYPTQESASFQTRKLHFLPDYWRVRGFYAVGVAFPRHFASCGMIGLPKACPGRRLTSQRRADHDSRIAQSRASDLLGRGRIVLGSKPLRGSRISQA